MSGLACVLVILSVFLASLRSIQLGSERVERSESERELTIEGEALSETQVGGTAWKATSKAPLTIAVQQGSSSSIASSLRGQTRERRAEHRLIAALLPTAQRDPELGAMSGGLEQGTSREAEQGTATITEH